MLQLYHLESKIDLEKLHQKEAEYMMSEINEKTQRWLSRLKEETRKQ